jgi:hypothetical protein
MTEFCTGVQNSWTPRHQRQLQQLIAAVDQLSATVTAIGGVADQAIAAYIKTMGPLARLANAIDLRKLGSVPEQSSTSVYLGRHSTNGEKEDPSE